MLEPYEWKRSRTVLRREGASNRPDLVDSGDRAENYKEFLEAVDAFCSKVADAAVLLRNEASKRNERFNLEVDFKKIDAKAQDSLSKAKSARAKKLKGQ
jgi:hypothetical protein